MDKKQIKRGAVVAASAAALVGLVLATPNIAEAKSHKGTSSTSSSSSTAAPKAPKAPKFDNDGDHKDGGFRQAPISQSVTVDVPADGKTYKLVVTEVAPAAAVADATKPARPARTIVVDVTGAGSVTVSVPGLHPGDYTATLVAVASSQTITVAAPATGLTPAPTTTPTPSNG